MDLDQAVWVFDTSCFAPDQRRAWNTIRAKLVEGQKPTTNKRYTQCPECGSSRICFWMCRDRYGCYDCDWVEGHST